jgi:hypothetical protein
MPPPASADTETLEHTCDSLTQARGDRSIGRQGHSDSDPMNHGSSGGPPRAPGCCLWSLPDAPRGGSSPSPRSGSAAGRRGTHRLPQENRRTGQDVTAAVKADEEGRLDDLKPGIGPDPHIGALTQIFRGYAPEVTPAIVESVVVDVDEIVRQVRFVGWQTSTPGDRAVRREIRLALSKQVLQAEGALHDRAYECVRENY